MKRFHFVCNVDLFASFQWKFLIDKSPEEALLIIENDEYKYPKKNDFNPVKTGKKIFNVWHDPYESGEAYYEDWDHLDEFKSYDEAYEWCVNTYGKITEIE